MTTTNVQITEDWSEAHGTAEEIDVSCNNMGWYAVVSTSAPSTTTIGRLLMPDKVYNISLEGSENLYARTESGSAVLAIDN